MSLVNIFDKDRNIMDLKDSMCGKKGVIFLCGQNLEEHKNNFAKIFEDDSFITLAYKNSSNILPSEPDIIFLDTRIKETIVHKLT